MSEEEVKSRFSQGTLKLKEACDLMGGVENVVRHLLDVYFTRHRQTRDLLNKLSKPTTAE